MTFNIAFFADSHIGYRARVRNNERGINVRVQDGYDALREVISQIITSDGEDKVDAVICGGDLFHVSHPSIRDISTVQFLLRQLHKHGIPFYGLAGNHDANDIKAELPSVASVDDPERNIHAIYKPYLQYELTDGLVLHAVSHHGLKNDEAPEVIARPNAVNIFSTHGAALDPKNQTLMRCADSPREQFIPVEMLVDDTFAAKLLGHYHSRYPVGGEMLKAWYSGSTLRRGFSDATGERGWLLVRIDDNGNATVEARNISQRPQYDLDVIDAEGLTASEVMDLLTININRTKDADQEPIVRQRIINVNKGVRDGLDQTRLAELTEHMLLWQLEKKRPEEVEADLEGKKKSSASLDRHQSLDIVQNFKGWVNQQVQSVPEEYRDAVAKEAEEYLLTARNLVLQDGHNH